MPRITVVLIGWYGCGKEAEGGCWLRVTGYGLRVAGCGVVSLIADYLMHDRNIRAPVLIWKNSSGGDHILGHISSSEFEEKCCD